jgi:hypothetical protein
MSGDESDGNDENRKPRKRHRRFTRAKTPREVDRKERRGRSRSSPGIRSVKCPRTDSPSSFSVRIETVNHDTHTNNQGLREQDHAAINGLTADHRPDDSSYDADGSEGEEDEMKIEGQAATSSFPTADDTFGGHLCASEYEEKQKHDDPPAWAKTEAFFRRRAAEEDADLQHSRDAVEDEWIGVA